MSRSKKRTRKTRKTRQKKTEISREFKISIGIDPDKKPRRDPLIKKVTELPKTEEYKTLEKEQIIEDIFEEDLGKFLKRYTRVSKPKPIHSDLIPKWKGDRDKKKAVRWLNRNLDWPKHKVEVINVLRTLERYYDAEINKDNVILAKEIWDLFDDELTSTLKQAWVKECLRKKWVNVRRLSKNQAIAEQKALGYIHINDFDDYDREAAHVFSIAMKDYVYPENYYYGGKKDMGYEYHIYITFPLVGIAGYSKLVIPS